MRSKHDKRQQGFTLVELLIVIAVIGILAGLMFPAVGLVRQKAWDTASRELCLQTAAAWEQLMISHQRYPSLELLKSCAGSDAKDLGGDFAFPMNTEMTSLLNWWTPQHPLPRFDRDRYQAWLKNQKVNFTSWDAIERWPNDTLLERTTEQKKWGLIAPWAEGLVKGLNSASSLTGDARKDVETATVWCVLDCNGDGKVTVPDSLGTKALDAEGNRLVLVRSAATWVYSDAKKSRVVVSW